MRLTSLSLSLQRIGAKTTMSSSHFNARGPNSWWRGFSDHHPLPPFAGVGYFVNEESHMRTVREENHRYQQGHRGNYWIPRGNPHPPQQFHPPPADYRNWIFAHSQPPPGSERFTVVSYNILADYLARNHRFELYDHIPPYILDWEWRKTKLLLELGVWSPDIMCLQEVDKFQDLEEELTLRGYAGIWKMRTGNAVDGCATFWRTNRFHLRHEEHIEFNKLGLRDNVAQICVLESRIQIPAETPPSTSLHASCGQSNGVNQVVICNIHVLYNTKRGEIKLGQVRVLLDRAYAVAKTWNDAPVIICGDFNCTPKSPLYNFISDQRLFLSGLARNQVSGQCSASIYAPRPYAGSTLYSTMNDLGNSENPDPNFFKELHGMEESRGYAEAATCTPYQIQRDPFMERASYNPCFWTPMELEVASGNAECMFVEHSMKLRSAYADVEDCAGTKEHSTREPQVTSYHRKFMGTVDYIWLTEGLQTIKVLDTIPKEVLQKTLGFPTHKWGSDHLALACQLAFTKNFRPPR